MLLLFPQYRIGLGVGWILTAFAAGMMIRSGAFWLWPALTVVLCGLLCLAIAEMGAVGAHQRLLLILYQDADPRRFIQKYEPLAQKSGLAASRSLTMHAYLSNAYLALGDAQKALALLDEAPPVLGREQANAAALLAGNRCSIYLQMGDAAKAREQLDALKELCDRAENAEKKPDLFGGIPILEVRCALLEGRARSRELVSDRIAATRSPLLKADLQLLLAQILVKQKRLSQAAALLEQPACENQDLWAVRQAQALLAQIRARSLPAETERE